MESESLVRRRVRGIYCITGRTGLANKHTFGLARRRPTGDHGTLPLRPLKTISIRQLVHRLLTVIAEPHALLSKLLQFVPLLLALINSHCSISGGAAQEISSWLRLGHIGISQWRTAVVWSHSRIYRRILFQFEVQIPATRRQNYIPKQ